MSKFINPFTDVGFKRIFNSSYSHLDQKPQGIEVVKVADIPALVRALFK